MVGQSVQEAVQPYSPEYRSRGAGEALNAELGRVGGGGVLTDPAQVFARPPVARRVPHPLWPWLMGLAALLLVLDVASRRLDIAGSGPASIIRNPAAAGSRYAFRRPPPAVAGGAPPVTSAVAEPVDAEPEVPVGPQKPAVEVDPGSYAGRLLAARKTARKKLGEDE